MEIPFAKPVGLISKDPDYRKRVTSSFDKQSAMRSLGIELQRVEPGFVELSMGYDKRYTQQHGFIHAGIVTTALDSACGYAAFSLMEVDAEVLTVEFKTNLLSPAKGDRFIFCAKIVKPGRTLSVCDAQAFAISENAPPKLIASMTGTLMAVIRS